MGSSLQKLENGWVMVACWETDEIMPWSNLFWHLAFCSSFAPRCLLPKAPPNISKLLKNLFFGNAFKITDVLALVLSAPLLPYSNLRAEIVSFDSNNWMSKGLSGCDVLNYDSWGSRLHNFFCCETVQEINIFVQSHIFVYSLTLFIGKL